MDNDRIARNLGCVEKHFHSEAVDEVEAALELYTDDIVWDAPALNGLDRRSPEAGRREELPRALRSDANVRFQFLQRFATEDRVVDDSIVTFEIARAGYWPWPPTRRSRCGSSTSSRCETARSRGSWS